MNWLNEYFLQKTSPLTLYLWAYPPLTIRPEGPHAPPALHLPHAGLPLHYIPGGRVEAADREFELPARYAGTPKPGALGGASIDDSGRPLISHVSVIAPSSFNPDFTIRIDDAFTFTPIFAADGGPGFVGSCLANGEERTESSSLKLPWLFQGYLTI